MRLQPDPVIVCVECGGRAHLLQPIGPEDELVAGDVVAYRCEDCRERFDVEVSEEDLAPDED